MNNSWDLYWGNETDRTYWLKPEDSIVKLARILDDTSVRNVLDLGCGIGRHALYFSRLGYRVTAVDSSSPALSDLNRQARQHRLDVDIVQGSYLDDLFKEGSFDLVLSFNVIYHGSRETMTDAIELTKKWLKPGGFFYFTCPSVRDGKFGDGKLVAPDTYRPLNSLHPGDIHFFAGREVLIDMLNGMEILSQELDEHYWDNKGQQQFSSYWRVLAKSGKNVTFLPL
jgi:tellurite methyltransferase